MPRFLFAVLHRYALALLCLSLLAAAGGIFWYSRATADAAPNAAAAASAEWTDAPADDTRSGSDILLGLAREAMHDGRLLAPAGSNAWEFYLSVLQLEPQNRVAQEALRESFPRAANEIERTINRRELEEARREIDLLREFDRDNFTLALLGGKLSAARNIVMRQHEAEAERIRQANAARGAR
ncbi:energy transducer TonB [Rhodanobacter sp. KK11]|uniref:energy transducer TonB n=1 Tax=Rhodanobacter sp. KK11 TaxID=3083255 RepID=UPI00296724F4|nr:energy transducer TonB [Rhodanobacter sp. KK11]MDW2981209.1 energy transducer TonB [Rhodanobacter sp. KK11]